MSPEQIKCIGLMISTDMTQKAIAEEVGVSQQTICSWKKNPEFIEEHEKMLKAVIRSTASQAFRRLTSLMDADSEAVQFNAAKYILEMAGYKPEDTLSVKGHVNNPLAGLTTEELKKLVVDD